MSLIDLYESLASKFFALLWIVQKNKELKWSKTCCQKKKKSLPRFPKEKNKTIGSGEKKKSSQKKSWKKTISTNQKKPSSSPKSKLPKKTPNKLNSFNWNW